MKEKSKKLVTFICLGLAVLATVMAIVFALDTEKNSGLYNIAYGITFGFVVLTIAAIVIFVLMQFLRTFKDDKKKAIKTLIVLGIAIVVCLVSYLLATGNDVSNVLLEKNQLTQATSKWIGAACILVYILVVAAAVAIIYVEASKSLKKK